VSQDTRIGTEIAGYRIESLIGRGGMSVVYLAHHEGLERKAALKLLAPELAENDAFRQRFIRESRVAAGLDHPNVIPVYDAGEVDGLLFIAMRYVSGSDLKTLLADHGRLDAADVVRVMSQLGAALDAAHEEGLVHRDVKPANVLLSRATPPAKVGHLYLADFGLTKKSLSGSGITRSGQFVGTIDYVAPEQIRSEPVDGRTDVYSLGCLLYECLSGEPPFVRDTEVAVMFSHLNDPPPKPSDTHPELPRAVDDVVAKSMAKVPADRYASAGELAGAAIQALRPALGAAPEVGSPVAAPPTRARRRRSVMVGGAGVALVVAVAVILALVAGNGGAPPAAATSPPDSHAAIPTVSASPTSPGITVPAGFQGVARLDSRTGALADRYPLALPGCPCRTNRLRPLLAAEGAVWVERGGYTTELVKINPDDGTKVDRVKLLPSATESMWLAAGESSLWVLTFRGLLGGFASDTLFRIDPGSDAIVARISINGTGAGLAIGSREGVWVARTDGTLLQIDPGKNRIARTLSVGDLGSGVAVAGGYIWMSNNIAGVVYRVDPATERVTTVSLPGGADDIAGDATGVWVMDRASGFVVRIDPGTDDLGQQIRVGPEPTDIAVGAGDVWVADPGEGLIYRIDPGSAEGVPFPVSHPSSERGPGQVSVGEGGVWTALD
jgi:streptogramin lyase